MSVRMQCLKRIGENVKKNKLIILDEKDEVRIYWKVKVTHNSDLISDVVLWRFTYAHYSLHCCKSVSK